MKKRTQTEFQLPSARLLRQAPSTITIHEHDCSLSPSASSDHPVRPHSHFGFSILDFRFRSHRITRSALASTVCGIVSPICLAVLRLIANSNAVAAPPEGRLAWRTGDGFQHPRQAYGAAIALNIGPWRRADSTRRRLEPPG